MFFSFRKAECSKRNFHFNNPSFISNPNFTFPNSVPSKIFISILSIDTVLLNTCSTNKKTKFLLTIIVTVKKNTKVISRCKIISQSQFRQNFTGVIIMKKSSYINSFISIDNFNFGILILWYGFSVVWKYFNKIFCHGSILPCSLIKLSVNDYLTIYPYRLKSFFLTINKTCK